MDPYSPVRNFGPEFHHLSGALRDLGFGVWGFRGLGFRCLRGLGFRGLGALGDKGLGI